jgi:signal transduction histidine kinase
MSETNRSTSGTHQTAAHRKIWLWTLCFFSLIAGGLTLVLHDEIVRSAASEFSVGRELRMGVHGLTAALFRFQLSGEDRDRSEFQEVARRLSATLADAKRTMPGIVDTATIAYERFLSKSDELLSRTVKAIRKDTATILNQMLEANAAPVISAADQLQKTEKKLKWERLERLNQLQAYTIIVDIGLFILTGLTANRLWKQRPQGRTEKEDRLVALGTLAASVAHEIRNPLTAIKFHLFRLNAALSSSSSANEDFQLISREIERLDRIVQDFLRFAKPSKLNFAYLDADALLRSTRNLLAPELSKRHIEINIDAVQPIKFYADCDQLQQVLVNLTQNAADSMPDGGSITLRARRGATSIRSRNEPVAIVDVADTGAGVPSELERKLFDPFVTTKEGGVGLGLSIAARIVEKHGGLIQYATHPKHGTTFSIILPRERSGIGNENSAH